MTTRIPDHILRGETPQGYWANTVLFKLAPDAKAPTKAHEDDAGWDLYTSEEIVVEGFGKGRASYEVPTGLFAAIPVGFWAHILPRSSTFKRYGLHVISAVIDAGYRGEMFIQCVNPSPAPVIIPRHTRLAQLIFHKVYDIKWQEIIGQNLPVSKRGNNGFGSSGK